MTGMLFGLMHAPTVRVDRGPISLSLCRRYFYLRRAWTGTVLASFIRHLG